MNKMCKKFLTVNFVIAVLFFGSLAFAQIPENLEEGIKTETQKKSEFKVAIKKLSLAMLGVVVSTGIIFVGLSTYKRFFVERNEKNQDVMTDNILQSPINIAEAVNVFLNKTK